MKKKNTTVVPPVKPKKGIEKKKANHKSDKSVSKKSTDATIPPDEIEKVDPAIIIDDSILQAGSDHSMDDHSFTEATSQQQYIILEEPTMHMSYDFDGVHLEEDASEDPSTHDNTIPSSVAISIDGSGNQHQQPMNSVGGGGTNPLFDVSDPSMDDSISKNYDSRYDGSLQDLTYNHGNQNNNNNSKGSINNFSGGSWNPNNDNPKSNSEDSSDSSSEMDEMKGYLSAGELLARNPNLLLQPYVGERPPTPPSPMRSMNGREKKHQQQKSNKTSSPIKSITTKAMIPNNNIPKIMETNQDDTEEPYQQRYITNSDLVGIIDMKGDDMDDSHPTTSERAPSSSIYRNKQFDDFYPTDISQTNEEEMDHLSNDHLLDVSIQPSCTYDEENGGNNTTSRVVGEMNGDKNPQDITSEDDKEKKQKRTIRLLIVVLTCALVALLAMGAGVVVLIWTKNTSNDESITEMNASTSQPPTIAPVTDIPTTTTTTSAPGNVITPPKPPPMESITTSAPVLIQPSVPNTAPTRNSSAASPITNVPVTVPLSQPPVAPTNAPILQNASASLPNPVVTPQSQPPFAPTNAPIERSSTSASLNNTVVPIATPIAVTVPSPVATSTTLSPTATSIVLD